MITLGFKDYNSVDNTQTIQQALRNYNEVVLEYVGKPWYTHPLHFKNGNVLSLDSGVILQATPGSCLGEQDALLNMERTVETKVVGTNSVIRMNKAEYLGLPGEWRHTINCRGAKDVIICGIYARNSGGDGLYIGPTWDDVRTPCENIQVTNCKFSNHTRQGITVVSCDDLYVDTVCVAATKGKPPQAGIDCEPSHPDDLLKDILFRNVKVIDNAGSALFVNISRLNESSEEIDVTFDNCIVDTIHQYATRVMYPENTGAYGNISFIDCLIKNAYYPGFYSKYAMDSQVSTYFKKCTWDRVGELETQPAFHIIGTGDMPGCGIVFKECAVIEHRERQTWKIEGLNNVKRDMERYYANEVG